MENFDVDEPRRPGIQVWKSFWPSYIYIAVNLILVISLAIAVGLIVRVTCPNYETGLDYTRAAIKQDDPELVYRLPRSVSPISYDLRLLPLMYDSNGTVHGDVKIRVKIVEKTWSITLHALDIEFDKENVTARLIHPGTKLGHPITVSNYGQLEITHSHKFDFNERLEQNAIYELSIKFRSRISDSLTGLYRSTYMENGERKQLLVTQFQPMDARRVFPCFDEPAFKAKFNITIGRLKNLTAISNMPKVEGEPKEVEHYPDYVWDVFEESLPMSTYLVAFAISEFAHRSNGNITVWSRKDVINGATWALETCGKILKFFENYFDMPYPLKKLDLIAVPDAAAEGMENWGLITFREGSLLYEPNVSATRSKGRIIAVMAHELAHQWFGNLVTPAWWNDLWLNEGFANYMEYVGQVAIVPAWRPLDLHVINDIHNTLTIDAMTSSHTISLELKSFDEIMEIFDSISYGKGAALIRMMSSFLTEDVFRRGLSYYLRAMSYESADQNDLWRFLSEAARINNTLKAQTTVKEIMDPWTLQTGFPVLIVTRALNRSVLHLEQHRFNYTGSPADKDAEPLWWIPLTYTTSKEANFENTMTKFWMPQVKTMEIEDTDFVDSDWFIFNIREVGYYRVLYDEANWDAIAAQLQDARNFRRIAPVNRAQIIDDSMNLARAGMLSYDKALNITRYLEHEDDYVPWEAAIGGMYFMDTMLGRDAEYSLLQKYFLKLSKQSYDILGFDEKPGEDLLTTYRRAHLFAMACHVGYEHCIDKVKTVFKQWTNSPDPSKQNPVAPNAKEVVYCNAIRYGTEDDWNFMYERLRNTTISSEIETLISSLACSRDMSVLTRYLEYALNETSGIRRQDLGTVFGYVSSSPIGTRLAFDFIRQNYDRLKTYLGDPLQSVYELIRYVTRTFNTEYELKDLIQLITTQIGTDIDSMVLRQTIENVETNIKWMKKNRNTIMDWLRNVVGDDDLPPPPYKISAPKNRMRSFVFFDRRNYYFRQGFHWHYF